MLKYVLFVSAFVFLSNTAKCQRKDTIRVCFKNGTFNPYFVRNIVSADFVRLIFPLEPGDDFLNVKEFYKNGKIKHIGKVNNKNFSSIYSPDIVWEGDQIGFYTTGRKEKITTFDPQTAVFSEYSYYPNGNMYCYSTYKQNIYNKEFITEFNECYDEKGDALCKDGNGQWIIYDRDYKNVVLSGKIKKGHKDGEWSGSVTHYDSIKYSYKYNYKNGQLLNSIGYDRLGKAYPFTEETVLADYKGGPFTFLELFRDHLKTPKDASGKKMSIDSIYVSFIVEKNGHLTNLQIIGMTDKVVTDALNAALAKSPDWNPTKYWGIPLRTKVVFPLMAFRALDISSRDESINFNIRPLER